MLRAREATLADYAAMSRLWAELGTDQQPPEPARWDELHRPYTLFLEDEAGALAAYALVIPLGTRGDIRHIVVAPEYRGKRIGKQLMQAVADRLRAQGCSEWVLEVRDDNAAAIALYKSVGMRIAHEIEILRIDRPTADAIARSQSGTLRVDEVDPADDAALEEWFDLARGQLARWRTSRPAAVFWRIADKALAQYWRDFLPNRALMFPFRAVDGDHAATFIAAARDAGMPDELELLIVGQVAASALRRGGARLVERLVEMRGKLGSDPSRQVV